MPPTNKSLGQQLANTLKDVTDLIEATDDSGLPAKLKEQRSQLLKQISSLVDANLNSGDGRSSWRVRDDSESH